MRNAVNRAPRLAWTTLPPIAAERVWWTRVPKPWQGSSESRGAGVLWAEQLVPSDVMAAAAECCRKLRFDRDADSVDGLPTFELRWVREGRYTHDGLASIFDETVRTKLLPLIKSSELLPHGTGELVLCEALVRTYDEGQRRVHPAHYDGDALVTAVLELDCGVDDGCATADDGATAHDNTSRTAAPPPPPPPSPPRGSFYVQPGAHVSSRIPLHLAPGDVVAHSFDLQHGVQVAAGATTRRTSVVFWFTPSLGACADKSRPWYEAAAAAGDADAMYNVGSALDRSRDDPRRALALLRAAAESGHFVAQHAAASMLLNGRGCPNGEPDVEGAEALLEASAAQGFYKAQISLAVARHGRGDVAGAVRWLTAAAEQRAEPDVMYRLGMALCRGDGGVARDVAGGVGWVREAAEMGHPLAQLELGRGLATELLPRPDKCAATMSSQATATDGEAEAEVWLRRAAAQGSGAAAVALCRRYLWRGEVSRGLGLAGEWAARLTHVSSKWRWR